MTFKLKVRALLLLIVAFALNNAFTQTKSKTIPLHKFLQDNFDSTIIYYPSSAWVVDTEYLIMAKLNGFVMHFTYLNPYKQYFGRHAPQTLASIFIREDERFREVLPDTNRYFLPKFIRDSSTRNGSWNSIISQNIWSIKDDRILGEGCENKRCGIFDADSHTFYLITKSSIKQLYFYAPAFYLTRCCPNKEGLKEAVSIINTFKTTFGYQLNLVATTSSN
jgi:hypothetical protein